MASFIATAGLENRLLRLAARWVRPQVSREAVRELAKELGLEPVVANVLASRGFTDSAGARNFLHPSLEALHDPSLMRDMDVAVTRLWSAIDNGERVLLYGDYDADGTSSIVVLKKALEILGGRA